MKKIYVFETHPDNMVIEKTDDYTIAIRVGGRVAMLDFGDWYDLRCLKDELYISKKETSNDDINIGSEHPDNPPRQDSETSCAQMDWNDKKGYEQTIDKGVE